jgi:hypothetical protein
MFALVIFSLLFIFILFLSTNRRQKPISFKCFKDVPIVEYNFPIVGHGFSFSRDIMGFIQKCRKKYGDIFHVKIFRKNICIVCDKNMVLVF